MMRTAGVPSGRDRPHLVVLLRKAVEAVAEIGPEFAHYGRMLNDLNHRLCEGRFHLAVLGQFKRGKSTLLNALTGEPILPVGIVPLTAALGNRIQIVGDDIYVTNTKFIKRGIKEKFSNSVLIKLNQIGTVTETIEAVNLCRQAGWGYVISHRSAETGDAFMADFAVAMGGGQIKTGSACRSERIAKYNRLLEIETELGKAAVFDNPLSNAR